MHSDNRKRLIEAASAVLEDSGLPMSLRPYQREAMESLRAFLEDRSGSRRGYLSHATGLGKTVWFSALVRNCVGMRTLIIVPSKILVEQTVRKLVQFTGGMLGHLSSLKKIYSDDGNVVAIRGYDQTNVLVATDESFIRHASPLAVEFDPHLIIWDECHWAYIKQAQIALSMFPEAVVLGMSATPDFLTNSARGGYVPVKMDNGITLYAPPERIARAHFHTCIDERSVIWGIDSGWLAPLAWAQVQFEKSLDRIPLVQTDAGLDYDPVSLARLMEESWPALIDTVCMLYQDESIDLASHQVFAVCPSVKTAQQLADAIAAMGIPAAAISGETPDRDRNIMLRAFNQGEFNFFSSVMVLREGWDTSNADVCLMLKPSRSRVFYMQSLGRVLRLRTDGGYKVALVVDIKQRDPRMSPLSAPMLFAPPGSEIQERGILRGTRREFSGRHPNESDGISPFLPSGAQPKLVIVERAEIEYWAGEDGTFTQDGEVWGTPTSLALRLPVSSPTIRKRAEKGVETGDVRQRPARDGRGKIAHFYALSDVQRICQDLICPDQAGSLGWYEADGEVWASKSVLDTLLGVGTDVVEWLLGYKGHRSRAGKPARGMPTEYHCLSDLRRLLRKS